MTFVYINGERRSFPAGMALSFEQLGMLAFPSRACGPLLTVTWRAPDGTGGTLTELRSVKLANGMVFNVGVTGAA